VITLVYGLGFGMVIVLLVVPAILAMQQDFGQQVRAFRRALTAPGRGGPAVPLGLLVALLALVFAGTMGAQIVTGQMAGPLAGFGGGGLSGAAGVFIATSAVLCVLAWIGSAVLSGLRRTT
jgi:hypothetical protein